MRVGSALKFLMCACVLAAGLRSDLAVAQPAKASSDGAPPRGFLEKYCFDCHDSDSHKAGLTLDTLPFDLAQKPLARRWETVFDKLTAGQMPPKKADQPSEEERVTICKNLSVSLHDASLMRQQTQGRTMLRRLSRTQYEDTNHTVRPTPEAQGAFSHHPSLESFSTIGPFGVEALDAPNLKTVVLEHGAASDAIVARLANHPAVETLKLGEWGGSTLTDAAIPTLATIKKLNRLQIYLTALSYEGLRHLKDLPNLTTLDLIEVELPDGDLEKLKADLPKVKVTWKLMTPESRAKRQIWLEKARRAASAG